MEAVKEPGSLANDQSTWEREIGKSVEVEKKSAVKKKKKREEGKRSIDCPAAAGKRLVLYVYEGPFSPFCRRDSEERRGAEKCSLGCRHKGCEFSGKLFEHFGASEIASYIRRGGRFGSGWMCNAADVTLLRWIPAGCGARHGHLETCKDLPYICRARYTYNRRAFGLLSCGYRSTGALCYGDERRTGAGGRSSHRFDSACLMSVYSVTCHLFRHSLEARPKQRALFIVFFN